MWIKSFTLKNFKSFDDSGFQTLDRHINIVVGQNNSGKTALLQALAQRVTAVPHKNSSMRRGQTPTQMSHLEVDFVASGVEFYDAFFNTNARIRVPVSEQWLNNASVAEARQRLFSSHELIMSARYASHSGGGTGWEQLPNQPSIDVARHGAPTRHLDFTFSNDYNEILAGGYTDNVGVSLAPFLTARTYFFDAQRIPLNDFPYGKSDKLSTNAENLAQMLVQLQANKTAYENYIAQVRRVLPLVKWVSVSSSAQRSANAEIKIWSVEESSGRDDLTVPLSECGTGIGQVLAILYVVTGSSDNVIVIDEPNSFLHPLASKELIRIISENAENQFIISSHSPEMIVAARPERLFSLRLEKEKTILRALDRNNFDSIRQILDELGSRLSDVFGADYVLWVEGPTEVECFPILLSALGRDLPAGLAIAALRNTGDLETKSQHAVVIADIYRNLTSAHTILPTSIGICLDGDKRGIDNEKVLKIAFDTVNYFDRYCYENYLLQVPALTALLNGLPSFKAQPISEAVIEQWIKTEGRNSKYGASQFTPLSMDWIVAVDAAKLLEDMFQDLSSAREIYRKTTHSIALTKWIVKHHPAFIMELMRYVGSIIPEKFS